jgi:amino acid transporter
LILYIAIQLVNQGILGVSATNYKEAPLADCFCKIGITLIIITTALSMLGYLGGEILSVHRVLYASARDGLFPKP